MEGGPDVPIPKIISHYSKSISNSCAAQVRPGPAKTQLLFSQIKFKVPPASDNPKPRDITLTWRQSLFPKSSVVAFEILSFTTTAMSRTVRLHLELSIPEKGQPTAIFLKLAKLDSNNKPTGSGKKEVRFYSELAGTLASSSIPNCYFSQWSNDGHYTIALQDHSEHYKAQAWPEEEQLKQSQLALTCLAQIHAALLNHPQGRELFGAQHYSRASSHRDLPKILPCL